MRNQKAEDDYFADGLTEELISQLAHISGLNVIARTSVMKYKNTEMNIEEIGDELDVGTILQGSVRTASEKARINVQLIDVKTQQHLWSEDYDRELKDIFAIQSDIALRIADGYTLIGCAGYGFIPQDEVVLRAKEAVSKALALDESLANAYNSLAYINFRLEWNREEAEHNFKKAIEQYKRTLEIAPDYAETVFALGLSYNQKKMYKEAISELKGAINLSNGRPMIVAVLGSVYAASGLRSEVLNIYNDLVRRQSDKKISPYYAAIVSGALGNRNEGIDALYKAYNEHFGLMVYINAEPLLDPFRSDPKFSQLLKMVGLNNKYLNCNIHTAAQDG